MHAHIRTHECNLKVLSDCPAPAGKPEDNGRKDWIDLFGLALKPRRPSDRVCYRAAHPFCDARKELDVKVENWLEQAWWGLTGEVLMRAEPGLQGIRRKV